jgi:hypothetical protein
MNSDFFSPAHSCNFCRKLTLYKRDFSWWNKAVESNSEDPEIVGPVLSVRVKNWLTRLTEQLERREGGTNHVKRSLRSLADIAIFDCTIAEARDAAARGCSLCQHVISFCRLRRKEPEDATFLAAHIGRGVLGVVQRTTESKLDQRTFWVESSSPLPVFEIVALPGEYRVLDKGDICL